MKLDSILEQSFNLLGFGKNAHESKLKEQDSNPHLKDLQIFKMSKLRSMIILKRKNHTTLGQTHC
jgi:hypothetical protein